MPLPVRVTARPARRPGPRPAAPSVPYADDVASPAAGTAIDDIEALCAEWRLALDAAQRALDAAASVLRPGDLAGRATRLRGERAATAGALEALARERHVNAWVSDLQVPAWHVPRLLSLSPAIEACVFNLDGVLIGSATLHAAAWADTFNPFLASRADRTGGGFAGFDPARDYYLHVHGRPRLDGVRSFLASRGILLPEGYPQDPSGTETVHGLANRKREVLVHLLERSQLNAFAGSRRYLQLAGAVGIRRAVVSASANTPVLLDRARLVDLIDATVDGNAMTAESLRGKPAPDTLLAACRRLDVDPAHAAAFETTRAGVAAAEAAGFGLVIGIGDETAGAALRAAGASIVTPSLEALLERGLARGR